MKRLYDWTTNVVRYVRDPIDVETVQSPETTLKIKAGDCDDHATLMAAWAANLGIPARFVTAGPTPEHMTHIYTELLIDGRWIAADTTSQQPFGFVPPLPAKRIYDLRGEKMTALAAPVTILPLRKSDLQNQIYTAVWNQMHLNWQRGLINRTDVAGYLRVFDEGNSPFRNTLADGPARQAVTDFLARIDKTGAQSAKPAGQLSGMEGLDGFLKSIVKAVGSVVKGAVKLVTGGGEKQIVVNPPTINIPQGAVQTTVTPAAAASAAQAGVSEMFSNPVVIAALALGAILLLRK